MTSWCFTEADFVFGTYVSSLFYPPRDWSGTIPFTIVAEMVVQGYWITGYSATTLTVIPVPDPPVLRVGTACFKDGDDTQVEIPVSARLTDEDSEELEVDLDGLPEGFDVSTWTDQTGQEYSMADNGSSVLGQSSLVTRLIVKPTGQKMGPFNATVIAIAREKSNGLQNQTVRHITVEKCPPYPDMSVIFVVPPTTLEDKNIPFQVSVRFGLDESPRLMAIHILDLPPSASFNRGHRAINDSWILSRKDLAEEGLELIPPRRYSGDLILTGRTDVLYRGFEYQLNSSATITILPVVNAPRLSISPEVVCLSINTTNMTFSVDAALTDDDGSESLILTYNIPEEWIGSVGDAYHGSYSSMITQSSHELINVTVASPAGFIYPIEIPVVLMAVENANADQNIVYKVVRVQVCDAAQAAASAGLRQRTTIIWNVTTPQPSFIHEDIWSQPRSFLAHSNATLTKGQSGKNISALALYRTIVNSSSVEKDQRINSSSMMNLSSAYWYKNASRANTTGNYLVAESSLITVTQLPDQTQDDESVIRVNDSNIVTSKRRTTAGKIKTPKQNKEHGSTRSRDRSKPRTRKPKLPQLVAVTGKAKLDDIELEQHVSIDNGTEDIPIRINISVTTRNAPRNAAVQVRISGLPTGSYLDKGEKEASSHAWLLQYEDLGSLLLHLPQHQAGLLPIIITSTLELQRNKSLSARQSFEISVRPETDFGQIDIKGPYLDRGCVDKSEKEIRLSLKVVLEDNDGSEDVEFLEVTGIPKSVRMYPGRYIGSESSRIIFPKELPGLVLRTDTVFSKFRMTIDAKVREKDTGIRSSVSRQLFIETCTNGAASKESERIQRSNGSRFPNVFTALLLCLQVLLVLCCR
ncbi:hypothetical protein RvY_08972-1 [Ramazzottius varieornatus]|uniref:Uncharacterized protein n=1 Tax=Ramazzottius varieornatus TaxID=947166 RepID=A0A1D1VA97_RAMVA|nr:hypothetical protein RvY_08972-1 [Ramazzottius varieornatus]